VGKKEKNNSNGFYSTYYRSNKTKGTKVREKFIFLTNLPWVPKDTKNAEDDMKKTFSQTVDRVKEDGKFSYAYVIGTTVEEAKKYYKGSAKFIQLVKGSIDYLDVIVELIENEDIPDDEVVYVAKAIKNKANPSVTLHACNNPHLAKKHAKLIRAYRKRRKKDDTV